MADESSWSDTVKEWLVNTGYCVAGALASAEDGMIYAACYGENCGDEEAFAYVYQDDHEEAVLNDDGSEKLVLINEANTILEAVNKGQAPNGVWMGGQKYKCIMKEDDLESGDYKFTCATLARNKGGATLIMTSNGNILIAIYDEDLEQSKGNCRSTAFAFAEHLESTGY